MAPIEGARARARAEITAEIVAEARRQLADVGPTDLSLRAVARELGLVSSAVYRYVASRDELLTLMIIEAYESLGAHTERAVDASRARLARDRWVGAAEAIRSWSLAHPHEYALLYGTPVPGYQAPQDTTPAGIRVSLALISIVRDAQEADVIASVDGPPVSAALSEELAELRRTIDLAVPDEVLVRTLVAWTQLFGLLSFELFSQTRGVVTSHDELFRSAAQTMAEVIGL